MEKFKLGVMEKNGVEYDIYRNYFQFLSFLDYQDSDARVKIHGCSIELSSLSSELWIEPLMEEYNFVVLNKYDFGNRDLSLILTFLAFSSCQDSDVEKKIDESIIMFLYQKTSWMRPFQME